MSTTTRMKKKFQARVRGLLSPSEAIAAVGTAEELRLLTGWALGTQYNSEALALGEET